MMKNKKQLMRRGFTIIEMLVYSILLVLFLAVLSNLFLSSIDIKKASEGDSFTGQDARFIISRLTYDLKRADSISSPVLGASDDQLTISIGGTSYTYGLGGEKLTLNDGSATNDLSSSESIISDVTFQRVGNVGGKNSIKMTFSVNGQSYTTTFGTR